jgi:hypothetical protein
LGFADYKINIRETKLKRNLAGSIFNHNQPINTEEHQGASQTKIEAKQQNLGAIEYEKWRI